jgi:hypothetical protein
MLTAAAPAQRPFAAASRPCGVQQQQQQQQQRLGRLRCRATQKEADAEARLEALEASIKGKAPRSQRQIPIRGVTQPQKQEASSQYAPWKSGQLFPEGWEQVGVHPLPHQHAACPLGAAPWRLPPAAACTQMPLSQKVTELYMGQRGMMFWANKAAWASSITIGVLWVVFRLVLPALGIITLPGDR